MSEIKCYLCGSWCFPQNVTKYLDAYYCGGCAQEHIRRMQECSAPDCMERRIGMVKYCEKHFNLTENKTKEIEQLRKENEELEKKLNFDKQRCTCDENIDSPCLKHKRENELQDMVIKLKQALKKHKHTDECFNYAGKTASKGNGYHCIAKCADSYKKIIKEVNGEHIFTKCECGSRNIICIGGGYQEADASRNLPEIDGEEYACNDCGRTFWC